VACSLNQYGWAFKAIPKIVSIASIVEGAERSTGDRPMPTNHIGLVRLGVVSILAISAAPICAQAQRLSVDQLKSEARDFVKIVSGDKIKTQTYCEIVELNDQIDQDEDPTEIQELSQKRDKLEEKLGNKYVAFVTGFMNIDKDSRDYQEIASILEPLDKLCED
jgi:hypothetical protein